MSIWKQTNDAYAYDTKQKLQVLSKRQSVMLLAQNEKILHMYNNSISSRFPSISSPYTMTFKEAYLRLQEIHQMLQTSDMIDIEEIVRLQEEAKACYELCTTLLQKSI